MRAIHHLEHIVPTHETESSPCRLEVIDGLPHIAFRAEDECGDAVVGVGDVFCGADLHKAVDDLCVSEAGVAKDGAAGLEGLDDLVRLVAGEGEAGGGGVDFHGAPEGLLGAGCHAVKYEWIREGLFGL